MSEDTRWQQRLNNYVKTLSLLERIIANAQENWTETDVLASIQAFEMTSELSWNLLKDYMEAQGLNFQPTPKEIYRQAFKHQIVDDGQVWLDVLKARNLASHTYNEETANELVDKIQHKFLPVLIQLRQKFINFSEE